MIARHRVALCFYSETDGDFPSVSSPSSAQEAASVGESRVAVWGYLHPVAAQVAELQLAPLHRQPGLADGQKLESRAGHALKLLLGHRLFSSVLPFLFHLFGVFVEVETRCDFPQGWG